MSGAQLVLAHLVKGALLALLVGIVVRRRARLCWSFVGYVVVVLLGNVLVSSWPATFYTAWFWVLKQAVYDLAKVVVAVELAYRAFRAFPGARVVARAVLFGVLALSTLGITLTAGGSYYSRASWQPGIVAGTIWLFTATALAVAWYHLPIHPWQRAIMLGFAPYLLVLVTLLDVLARRGWALREELGMLDSAAYLVLVLWWAVSAWRPKPALAPASGLERLVLEGA